MDRQRGSGAGAVALHSNLAFTLAHRARVAQRLHVQTGLPSSRRTPFRSLAPSLPTGRVCHDKISEGGTAHIRPPREAARAVLAALETASLPSDMTLPDLRLHPLRGDRAGQWPVSISGNWRVIFRP